ncbi:PREDICTED: fas-binding factor 1 homolog isoform X2 [Wasmannia auropunctata]|uniref:fas-binding factor 1 homolog isoform X2 n=1 Tax=Wasmannia auropunctata TaxID=64793 RepID=UPI0005EDB9A7|nr:PREDICTED: fas-binding factor 1 homolog isoform X2 [Wasmannia auropunctata]
MTEMVEDMDSLDDKLFSNAFRRNPSAENGKKRITFADEDDPLTSLLADKEALPSSQKNSAAARDKRSIIDDLFSKKASNESLSSSKLDEKEIGLMSALSVTGFEKPKKSDDKAKKLSLMQDLFGDTSHTLPSKELVDKKPAQLELEVTQHTADVSKTQSQHSTYAPTALGTRESRRGKRTSEIINDPLGLFSLSATSSQADQTVNTTERRTASADLGRQKSETKEYLPDWLEPKKIQEDKSSDYVQDRVTPTEELFSRHKRSSSDKIVQGVANVSQEDKTMIPKSLPHEKEKLSRLSDNQEVEINEHEKQEIEENYSKSSHAMAVPITSDVNINSEDARSSSIPKSIGYENAVHKLELEKSHLSVTLHSLNDKYENEIMILDESYKRQIGFLQERTDTLEKRMQQELECLEADYEAKIEKLKNEKVQIETFYKEELQNLKKEHAQVIEEIYERHSQNIKLLQKEHFDTIESILKMREVENLAMTTIATHKTDLQNLLQKADFIIENIKNVHEKTDQRDDQSVKLREYYLKNQEEGMQIQNAEMKKQQTLLEQEREKIMKVADRLDSHVTQLVLELEKKSAMLNQALETLQKREQSLSHEKELFEEKVQWERNHLQALKESWFNEQEKQLKILTKEKEVIAAKKKQYEVLRIIKSNSDNVTKIESTAAIKAAQDATILADLERLKWHERLKHLERQQQILTEKKRWLSARAQDLESFTEIAFAKNEEAEKALREAHHIENEHKVKFNPHYGKFEEFNLASEKLALEKLKRSTNTSYSYIDKRPSSSQQHAFQVTSHFTEVVDPQLVMLKLNLDDQLDNIEYT